MLLAPDGRSLAIELKSVKKLEPRAVAELARRIQEGSQRSGVVVVSAPFLSTRTRELLVEAGVPYLDFTGNARLVFDEPGLFIETTGAANDPRRQERPARSLKGDKAARVVRWLLDFKKLPGVRAVAEDAEVSAGYVSRVLTLLDNEALIDRGKDGTVTNVRWEELLRRWAEDSPLSSRGEVATFIEPRGLQRTLGRLQMVHAVTGSLAASKIAPVAPARLATIYVNHVMDAAQLLELHETDTGANVILIAPRDRFVFDRSMERDGLSYAAPSQVAADLLSSPGRGPAEAEALIAWMKDHEEAWRG